MRHGLLFFHRIFAILAALQFGLALEALAWPPTYGLEFNLQSNELHSAWSRRVREKGDAAQEPTAQDEHRLASGLVEKLREACLPDCQVTEIPNGKFGLTEWKFTFASGFDFTVSVDPGTVELQVGPWNLEGWKKFTPEIQKWLFDFTKARGFTYKPQRFQENSAHLNIGLNSAVDADGRLFARYLADYWQHPELGSGILGDDSFNAPLLGDLSEEQRREAKVILENVNSQRLRPGDVARQVERRVYTKSPQHDSAGHHYQSVGLKYVTRTQSLRGESDGDLPFEFRANRQPLSAEQTLLQLELQERRLTYLKSLENQPVLLNLELVVPNRAMTRAAKRDRVTGFYLYLEEMGLGSEFERFRKLLDADHKNIHPWAFVHGKINWTNQDEVQALERFAKRARQSPAMLAIVKAALLQPEAAESPAARKILAQLGDLALDPSYPEQAVAALNRSLSPAEDPLCNACVAVGESPAWKQQQETQDFLKKFQAMKPTEMKKAPGFWSACQAFFGLLPKSP